mmetsp:Transcript_32114/g.44522  ORF Transcript_32114/g.44522 Transcript_32114/m.44522 type:complete len:322 (+) Transcript_32114:36-1001(+)|eukprot:CAMPEP_0196582406 /NCGR_PEP_ID=MMETSP1081-20130531/38808_1 /TAXON_ID=36882 /ORGANISM="Pyramimonas amylifera, Strain CCMP720" /LENGTH=321 /DNA_ID=CAMNT_0041902957 /DNA_START=35 /DNA_END=1000 /DNA_ORIENTATION=-
MKFKGQLSDNGVFWLQRRIVPSLERLGREVTLLFTPDNLTFSQDTETTHGIRVHAVFRREVLFESYGLKSQNKDKIAFVVNTAMLLRVLKSIEEDFQRVELRLVKRRMCPAPDSQHLPFLNFSTTGGRVCVVQDLPLVGRPLQGEEMNQLEACLPSAAAPQTSPGFYLDLMPLLAAHLPATVDRLKNINHALHLTLTQAGDFLVEARTPGVVLGSHHVGLKVMPRDQERARAQTPSTSTSTFDPSLLDIALETGEGLQVKVRVRDLARALQAHSTRPNRVLAGISKTKGFVQLALQYHKPNTDRIDMDVVMHIKLPVQVED